jgi:hypothetical protein
MFAERRPEKHTAQHVHSFFFQLIGWTTIQPIRTRERPNRRSPHKLDLTRAHNLYPMHENSPLDLLLPTPTCLDSRPLLYLCASSGPSPLDHHKRSQPAKPAPSPQASQVSPSSASSPKLLRGLPSVPRPPQPSPSSCSTTPIPLNLLRPRLASPPLLPPRSHPLATLKIMPAPCERRLGNG